MVFSGISMLKCCWGRRNSENNLHMSGEIGYQKRENGNISPKIPKKVIL